MDLRGVADDLDKQLRADVTIMGSLLGKTITHYAGKGVYNKIEPYGILRRPGASLMHDEILHNKQFDSDNIDYSSVRLTNCCQMRRKKPDQRICEVPLTFLLIITLSTMTTYPKMMRMKKTRTMFLKLKSNKEN